ncbi:hypothetical protein N1495_01625 [Streptococcus didelphis]|uniref:Uncharacterized protein n=1 Tax=Streptococcus didelphis TaxID=102886 RepID=A0ABY9LG27_9STRE|nr:hypothetical protein [Streptococcus didelphis]WMB27799.1 hypothetical protein N1496_06960 [Streptococcus didelphis]WMB29735.1 hypothetical protein N1495_01625 [Streptococcus didelphis]
MPLIQTGSEKIIEEGFGWEIKGEENHYLIAILPTSLIKGDKLYRLKGHKCRGKVVVYDKKHKKYYCLKS